MLAYQHGVLALLLIAAIGTCSGFKAEEENEQNLTNFLTNSMTKYGQWIADNKEDPSLVIPDVISLSRQFPDSLLECQIRRQSIRNHSKTTGDVPLAGTSFSDYYVVIGREVHQPYEFIGVYNCTGVIFEKNQADLTSDLPFTGSGNFTVKATSSKEFVEIVNLGVTTQHEFDFSHSWNQYFFEGNLTDVNLDGQWNNTELTKYVGVVQESFKSLYYNELLKNFRQSHLNPSGVLLIRYGNEILRNLNLTEIIEKDKLPPPYSATAPTPTTTTTSTPSTPTATNGTNPATNATTPEATTPVSGATSSSVNSGIVVLYLLSVILTVFLTPKL